MAGETANLAASGVIMPEETALPELREELELVPSSCLDDGSPSWTIVDHLQQRYYRIGWREFEILSRWHARESAAIVAQVNRQTTLNIGLQHVEEVARFLKRHNLVKTLQSAQLFQQYLILRRQGLIRALFRNYLFLKIPLCRPDRFLSATMPAVRIFFSPFFWTAMLVLGLFAAYLTMRQFDAFQQTFSYFFSMEGLVYYGVALTFTKIIHELGHAYSAKRYGLNVPTMGVAVILLWPVLYTDTTDAWRLASKKQRLRIGYAGMLMEIATAIVATLLWNFMPEGPARSAVFFLATTSWLLTLSVNLNPLMRFDGYFILSDLLDVPNLQKQAFELAKWRVRKMLFGFRDLCPVNLPAAKKRIVLIYAYCTWLYRFFLFLGIALLVYHFSFKILGIFLMALELTTFIAMPIARELNTWWQRRSEVGFNWHLLMSSLFLGGLIFLTLFSWPTIIQLPATYEAAAYSAIYPSQSGRLMTVSAADGDTKMKGEPLFSIYSSKFDFLVKQAQLDVDVLKLQLKKVISSREGEEQIQIVQKMLTEKLTSLRGYEERLRQLVVTAPITGRVIIATPVISGQWVSKDKPLMAMIDENDVKIDGYVHENFFHYIKKGAVGIFYDETSEISPFQVTIEDIDPLDTKYLPEPYLASVYGGDIPVELSKAGKLMTHAGYYKVTMLPQSSHSLSHVVRGTVRFEGQEQNLFQRIWPQTAAVFIRESGF